MNYGLDKTMLGGASWWKQSMEVQLPSEIVRPTDALHLFSGTRKHNGITCEKGKAAMKVAKPRFIVFP